MYVALSLNKWVAFSLRNITFLRPIKTTFFPPTIFTQMKYIISNSQLEEQNIFNEFILARKQTKSFQNGVVKNDFIINPICDKCRDGK